MVEITPQWDEIAGKWQELLNSLNFARVYYTYPDSAVDPLELPCVVINEPQTSTQTPFTNGAFTMTWAGEISLLVKAVDTGQARLYRHDIAEIEAFNLGFSMAVHGIRQIKKYASNISLGAATTARFSPYDPDNRGNYAGKSIPYTVMMQYRS